MHNAQTAMNPAVDAVGKMHISGNVIPNTWYQTIQTSGGKPYLNAIILLADIVYWYRPTEVRDERSGKTTGMQQKFREDLLQRSYAALSDQFGLSRKQIKDALVFLENLGVITRVFRNKIVGGQCLSNVMYLDLHAAKLYELTYSPNGNSPIRRGTDKYREYNRDFIGDFRSIYPSGSGDRCDGDPGI